MLHTNVVTLATACTRVRSVREAAIGHSAHPGKVARMLAFVRRYQHCCGAIFASEWRAFFQTGTLGGEHANSQRFDAFCGAAAAQMARAQVTAMLASFVSGRQNEFRRAVHQSALDSNVKHMLYFVNVRKAWQVRDDIAMPKTGEVIAADVRKLATTIWRSIRKRRRKPNARGIAPVLDRRIAEVDSSKSPHADLWATFKFVGHEALSIPLHIRGGRSGGESNPYNVIQIVPKGDTFTVRLMSNLTEAEQATAD